ncbi:hypothetical protein LCGC14_0547090 [marine sediment metagenome]|uniref:Histidine kinase/HSP90-like ATPase domain-containing protein n=1 Tax=marine sediment metagenome TaxID=412755 RepID=A0A0F9S9H2_9ZZZZ
MKLPGSNIATETSGLLASKAFGIGDAGMILDILRTKIYSDPILAICREITCNARDAHREVGTPERPIEVHFPNHWSTNLIIKDYGPGISPSRMEDIFIKFGCSTKRSDNVQQGAFGLGCKTPFAYSDTFTVTTIVDKVKYTYSAYIDETKVGQMTLLQQEEVSEDNGTSIEVPISRGDYDTFVNMIVKVTQHWDVKPQLFGQDAPAWKTFEYSYTGDRWKLPKQPETKSRYSYSYGNRSLALIDGIEYKIDKPSLVDTTDLHKAVLNTGFHFTFNVGELSLAASRDSIHYDEDTQKLLIDRIDALILEIVSVITDQIKNATTYAEACNAYEKVKKTLNHSGLIDQITGIQWRGNDIRLTVKYTDIGKWAKMTAYTWDAWDDKIKTARRDFTINWRKADVLLLHHDIKSKSVPSYVIEYLISNSKEDATPIKSVQVVWTEDEPTSSKYTEAVRRAHNYKHDAPVVKYNKDLLKLIGFKSLKEAIDSVPKEKKKQRKSRGKIVEGNIMGYTLSCSYNSIDTVSTSFPLNQGGAYIQVNYKAKEYKSSDKYLAPIDISRLKTYLGETVVGFTEFRVKKLGDEWVPLIVAAKAKLDEELKNITVYELNNAGVSSNYLFEYHMNNLERLRGDRFRDKLEGKKFVEYIDESKKITELLAKHLELVPILKFFGIGVQGAVDNQYNTNLKADPNCKLALLYNAVKDRYPLLRHLRTNSDETCEAIVEYMNLIDNKIEQEKQNVFQLTGT